MTGDWRRGRTAWVGGEVNLAVSKKTVLLALRFDICDDKVFTMYRLDVRQGIFWLVLVAS
jgi:hypothetical protein